MTGRALERVEIGSWLGQGGWYLGQVGRKEGRQRLEESWGGDEVGAARRELKSWRMRACVFKLVRAVLDCHRLL